MKTLGLLLIFSTVLALTVACNNNNETPNNETPTPTATQPAATGDTTETTPEETPAPTMFHVNEPRDLGGRVIRHAARWDQLGNIIGGYEEPDPATAANYARDMQGWENQQRVRRDFNVDFEQVVFEYEEMLPALTTHHLAGDPLGDWVFLSGSHMLPAIQGAMILPISAYAPPGSDLMTNRHYVMPVVEFRNDFWTFNRAEIDPDVELLGVNLDIINAVGAPNPIDLYESGQWTWDAFLDIMRQASLGGYFGIATQPDNILLHLMAANDAPMISPTFQYNFDHPNAVAALEFASNIFGPERLWHYDPADGLNTGNWARNFNSWTEGVAAFWNFVLWNVQHQRPSFEWGVVPWPMGPNNRSGNTWSANFPQSFAIPVHVQNPDDVYVVLEELLAWAWGDLDLLLEASLSWWRDHMPTEDDVQRMIKASEGRYIEMASSVRGYVGETEVGFTWVLGSFLDGFWNQSATLMEMIERERPPRQELLDSVFGSN